MWGLSLGKGLRPHGGWKGAARPARTLVLTMLSIAIRMWWMVLRISCASAM